MPNLVQRLVLIIILSTISDLYCNMFCSFVSFISVYNASRHIFFNINLIVFKFHLGSINSTISDTLENSTQAYIRYGRISGNYYYKMYQVTTTTAGYFAFSSNSGLNAYGYMYLNSFYEPATLLNLIVYDDDTGGNGQFRFTTFLIPDVRYILIFTTYSPDVKGSFSITANGPAPVTFISTFVPDTTTTSPFTITTSVPGE